MGQLNVLLIGACSKRDKAVAPPIKRCSVDAEHIIRFHVWTENFCSFFAPKVAFSNLSGIVWTRPKKACKKLYSLRVLRRARVSQSNMLRIYLGSVRPVLEYAVPVWQDIPVYLSEAIQRVQKRALNIIYPEAESYVHALQLGNLDRLDDRPFACVCGLFVCLSVSLFVCLDSNLGALWDTGIVLSYLIIQDGACLCFHSCFEFRFLGDEALI